MGTESDRTEIDGDTDAIAAVRRAIAIVAPTDARVLVEGETGTGKERVARAIHAASPRRRGPFVAVNCAAIPRELVESELFGHARGAFTGATRERAGRFEAASGGTLLLDEVGDLALGAQAKLLRVLQESEVERVGDVRARPVDVRVVAATNRDLEEEVRAGRFRIDLFYRLSVFPIRLPALRERAADVPALAHRFLAEAARRLGRSFEGFTTAGMARLVAHDWPGNVRELENVVQRAAIVACGPRLDPEVGSRPVPAVAAQRLATLVEAERAHVLCALERARWVIEGPGGAAALLEVRPSSLRSRMRRLGLTRPSIRPLWPDGSRRESASSIA